MRTQIEVRAGEGGVDALTFANELATALATFTKRRGHEVLVDASSRTVITVKTTAPS